MPNIYVRSTDGNNADSGASWALAKATVIGAAAIDAAGDTIWVSQAHAEVPAGSWAPALAGTEAAPIYLLCGDDAAEPPTALATTATITAAGGTVSLGSTAYCYGITFSSGSTSIGLNNSNSRCQRVERCKFRFSSAVTASTFIFNSSVSGANRITVIDCQWKFAAATQGWSITNGYIHVIGGSFESGTTSPTTLIKSMGTGNTLIEGFDFSNLGTSFDVTIPPVVGHQLILRRVKFPASWAGDLISAAITAPARVSMYNYTIGSTDYLLWIEDLAGVIKSETTIIMDNGASDGAVDFSWKMTSNSNAEPLLTHLYSDEMLIWTDTVGGSPTAQHTITVNILHDSATALTDDEVWLEVRYLGTTSSPLGSTITDRKSDTLATAADQDSSSETWTTTGMSNPNAQKLSVTVAPGQKGYFLCRVALAKASKTIYVDPAPVLS